MYFLIIQILEEKFDPYDDYNESDEKNNADEDGEEDVLNCDELIENDGEDYEDEDFFNERSNKLNIEPRRELQGDDDDGNEEDDINHDDDDDDDHLQIVEDFDDQEGDADEQHMLDSIQSDLEQPHKSKSQCKFCSFIAKSPAKLQLHLATHYNLKPFMCPVCKRRANFKWDIQKHLRKIHNDHQSEVICLSESEARKSINSYIEHKQFVHNNNANSIIYENSVEKAVCPESEDPSENAEEKSLKNGSNVEEKAGSTESDSNQANGSFIFTFSKV